jgi:protocatechuate 3,4-dioxygenase beta subunit
MVRCFRHSGTVPLLIVINLLLFVSSIPTIAAGTKTLQCQPTPPDEIGPFYLPDAPRRNVIGNGYVIEGVTRQYPSCRPLAGAKIEFWHAGPGGNYEARYRGITYSDAEGRYRIETDPPGPYGVRPPHVHFYVTAVGFEVLITQHYPNYPARHALFDFVLVPDKK